MSTFKRLLPFLVMFLVIDFSTAIDLLEYSDNVGGTNAAYSGQPSVCQSFRLTDNYNITMASWFIKEQNSTIGNTNFSIYNSTAAGLPDQKVLQKMINLDLSAAYEWYNVTFDDHYSAITNTPYFTCIYNTNADNYVHVSNNGGNPYKKGSEFVTGAPWTNNSASDVTFRIYGVSTTPIVSNQTPTINLSTNLTNNLNSTANPFFFQVSATGTLVNTTDVWNLSIYYNGTLNRSFLNVANLNTTPFIINLTYGNEQVSNDINVTVYHSSDAAASSILRTNIFLDSVNPVVTSNVVNNSFIYNEYNAYLNVSGTCEDNNLFACNVSIIRLNPSGTFNSTRNSSLVQNISTTTYTTYFNNLVANMPKARYKLQVSAWDSHTNIIIPEYQWSKYQVVFNNKTYKGISFNNNSFNLSTDDYLKVNDFALLKKSDRFLFAFNFTETNFTFTMYLDSKKPLTYLPNSPFPSHFVLGLQHWVDFDSDDVTNLQVDYLPNFDVYRIRFVPIKKIVVFKSIGDLNSITTEWFFNVTDGFTIYANDSISGLVLNTFTVNVSNSSGIQQTKATTWGNVTFNLTGNFNTTITAPGYVVNTTINTPFNAGGSFRYKLFRENSLYLFFYDEETDTLINDRNITVMFINLLANSSQNLTSSGSIFIDGFSIGSYEIRYSAPDYRTNTYYVTISTGTTQSYDLYMVKNATSSLIVFQITDDKGNPLYNHKLKSTRFQLADNAYLLNAMSKTDSNGETSLYLVPNDIFYRFIIEAPSGLVLYSGTEQKIFSNTVYIRVYVSINPYRSLYDITSMTTKNLYFDNATKLLTWTWNNANNRVVEGCLLLVKTNSLQQTKTEQCTASPAATIVMNLTTQLNNFTQFDAYGYLETNNTFSKVPAMNLIDFYNQGGAYEIFGKSGLFLAYFLILVMFLVGVYYSFMAAVVYTGLSMFVLEFVGLTALGFGLIVAISILGVTVAVVNKI